MHAGAPFRKSRLSLCSLITGADTPAPRSIISLLRIENYRRLMKRIRTYPRRALVKAAIIRKFQRPIVLGRSPRGIATGSSRLLSAAATANFRGERKRRRFPDQKVNFSRLNIDYAFFRCPADRGSAGFAARFLSRLLAAGSSLTISKERLLDAGLNETAGCVQLVSPCTKKAPAPSASAQDERDFIRIHLEFVLPFSQIKNSLRLEPV